MLQPHPESLIETMFREVAPGVTFVDVTPEPSPPQPTMTAFRVQFQVPGDVTPKQRARANPGGKAFYAPRARGSKRLSYPEYKELVLVECWKALNSQIGQPVPGMLRFPHDSDWRLSVIARLGRGDADNVLGSIMDALNGFLWTDDSLVLQASVILTRVGPREPRGVAVTAWVLEENDD
jgi:Holliday junction resolvase RusA-like endonuclease